MKTVTLQDVARYAGVSTATVSRVLNHNPSVDEALQTRVHQAIKVLGYKPNRAAQRLRSNSSDVLGIIISDIQNPFFTSVVRGIEDAAYEHEMNTVLCNTDEDLERQKTYLSLLQAEQVAGIIVSPTSHPDNPQILLEFRATSNIPIILLDRYIEQSNLDAVTLDNVQGAYIAVKHLIQQGYRSIGMIGGNLSLTTGKGRYAGYRQALLDAGLTLDAALFKMGDFTIESGYELTRQLLTSDTPVDAFFVANNLMTIGTLRAIRESGKGVPDDIALIGFDDMPLAAELSPALTVISQPTYEMGQEAVRLLLRRIHDPDAPAQSIVLQPRLIVRQSCGSQLVNELDERRVHSAESM